MLNIINQSVSSVQSLSHVWLFATPWTAARQASLSIANFWSLLKLMSIESVMPSNQLFQKNRITGTGEDSAEILQPVYVFLKTIYMLLL